MSADDHAALRALGIKMASKNGYTPKQSSSLYVTDGDEIDYAYGRHRIFMYTFEMYPSHAKVSSTARFYPPDEQIVPQTDRNKDAIHYLMEQAGCLYAIVGKRTTHCGAFNEDFEISRGWKADPLGTDTVSAGAWQRANPSHDHVPGRDRPVGVDGARHRCVGRVVRELVRHRRRADHDPLAPDQAARDRGQPGVPLLPGPCLEFVVRRTCSARTSRPRTGRGRSSARSAAPRTRTRRPGRSPRSR